MKFAVAITLYNPTTEFIENLLSYTDSFPLVIVNDNTRDNSEYVHCLTNNPSIIYNWDGKNWGLPTVFNRSLQICREEGIEYLCTLDQDSKLSRAAIIEIESFIKKNDMSHVAIVAPKPIQINQRAKKDVSNVVTEVQWVICSGAFINVQLLEKCNIEYDEAYFIDRFDADLSWQIKKAGLKQLMLSNVEMPHACGDASGHSPLRNYYIFRNRFYFNDKYYSKSLSILRSICQTIRHCWYLIAYQTESLKKIRMLFFAIRDYREGKMGEIPETTLLKIFGR